jgi:hypothetical protein
LDNLLQNPKAAGQLISGIKFDITGATGTASSFTSSGRTSTISDGGAYTAGSLTSPLAQWQQSKTGSTFNLNVFSGGKPNEMIIGPDNHGGFNPSVGQYDNANPSITGHGPSVLGSATFTLTIPGVTTGSTISGVVFNFGTEEGEVSITGVPQVTTNVPDNGWTLALLGAGVLCIALLNHRTGHRIFS